MLGVVSGCLLRLSSFFTNVSFSWASPRKPPITKTINKHTLRILTYYQQTDQSFDYAQGRPLVSIDPCGLCCGNPISTPTSTATQQCYQQENKYRSPNYPYPWIGVPC